MTFNGSEWHSGFQPWITFNGDRSLATAEWQGAESFVIFLLLNAIQRAIASACHSLSLKTTKIGESLSTVAYPETHCNKTKSRYLQFFLTTAGAEQRLRAQVDKGNYKVVWRDWRATIGLARIVARQWRHRLAEPFVHKRAESCCVSRLKVRNSQHRQKNKRAFHNDLLPRNSLRAEKRNTYFLTNGGRSREQTKRRWDRH